MKKHLKRLIFITAFLGLNIYIISGIIRSHYKFRLQCAPFILTELKTDVQGLLKKIDINNDGYDEVVSFSPETERGEKQFSVFKPEKIFYQLDFLVDIRVPKSFGFLGHAYDKKKKTYLFSFTELKEGDIFIWETDNRQNFEMIKKLGDLRIKPTAPTSAVQTVITEDINGDGRKELLIRMDSWYHRYPRGLACFDLLSGELNWDYYLGPAIVDIEIRDLDNDKKKEIFLSTFAVRNGAEINGTSDSQSYVIAIDSNGQKIWQQEIGGWYTTSFIAVADLDQDGRFEVVSTRECHQSNKKEKGKVNIFDALTGEPKLEYSLSDTSLSGPATLKTDKGEHRVYVGDSKGVIRMFDKGLNLLKELPIHSPVKLVNTPSPSDQWDIIIAMTPKRMQVFDKNLRKKIFSHYFKSAYEYSLNKGAAPSFLPVRTRQGLRGLVNADKLYLLDYKKSSFSELLKSAISSGLLFSVILIILLNAAGLWAAIMITKQQKAPKSELDTLMMQEVAHQVKNPLSTILFSAERIKGMLKKVKSPEVKKELSQVSEFLSDDVNTLKQHTNHILKLIAVQQPKFQEKKLKPLLESVVNRYRHLKSEGIDIELDMEDEISLYLDEELLKGALCNLLDNAVDAVGEQGKIKVSVIPVLWPLKKSLKEVVIEIEDTGCGISEEDLSHIFVPHFSSRHGGTGLGLTIARRIIEAHGGRIDVHSRKGFGTRFAIHLLPKPPQTKQTV